MPVFADIIRFEDFATANKADKTKEIAGLIKDASQTITKYVLEQYTQKKEQEELVRDKILKESRVQRSSVIFNKLQSLEIQKLKRSSVASSQIKTVKTNTEE